MIVLRSRLASGLVIGILIAGCSAGGSGAFTGPPPRTAPTAIVEGRVAGHPAEMFAASDAGTTTCQRDQLAVSITGDGAGAGTAYSKLTLRNDGRHACAITGNSAVGYTDANNQQVGYIVSRKRTLRGLPMIIRPHRTAFLVIALPDGGMLTAKECRLEPVAATQVYLRPWPMSWALPGRGNICSGPGGEGYIFRVLHDAKLGRTVS